MKNRRIIQNFFDFYVINEMWFRVLGKNEYGYSQDIILPHSKERRLMELFHETVSNFALNIYDALKKSVFSEIRHWPRAILRSERKKEFNKGLKIINNRGIRSLNLAEIRDLFSLKCWKPYYGGKYWAQATDLLIKLEQSRHFKDIVFILDQILDLHHNTGHILNKTKYYHLSIGKKKFSKTGEDVYDSALDFRASASIESQSKFCSPAVKKFYIANKRLIFGQ